MVVWMQGSANGKKKAEGFGVHWGSRNDWAPVARMWGSHPGAYCSPKPGVRWGGVGGTYVGIFYQSKWKWV